MCVFAHIREYVCVTLEHILGQTATILVKTQTHNAVEDTKFKMPFKAQNSLVVLVVVNRDQLLQ